MLIGQVILIQDVLLVAMLFILVEILSLGPPRSNT